MRVGLTVRRAFRCRPAVLAGAALLQLAFRGEAGGQTLDQALSQLRSGEYDVAIPALRELAAPRGTAPSGVTAESRLAAYVSYVRALAEVGRYDKALEVAAQVPEALSLELANSIGEVLYEVGRVDEAREHFEHAWRGGARDRHTARLNRAILEWTYGNRNVALTEFDSFIDLYNDDASLSAGELTAIATAVRYLGIADHELFQDARRRRCRDR